MKLPHLLACAFLALTTATFAGGAGMGAGGRMIPRPMPPSGWTCIWVSPVFRNITDSVWIPETSQLVSDWMQISPGRYEQIWRQVVIPGHYQTTTRQVLIADGHWELVRIDPPPIYVEPPVVVVPPPIFRNPGTVRVEGYASGATEDLSKFSPLTEWPK